MQAINNVTVISDMHKVVRPREGEEDTRQRDRTQKVDDANADSGSTTKQLTRRKFAEAMKKNIEENQVMAKQRRLLQAAESNPIQQKVNKRSTGEDANVGGQGGQRLHLHCFASGSSSTNCTASKAIARLVSISSNMHKPNERRDHSARD